MNRVTGWLVLLALLTAGSALLGWWTVPALAALYGLVPFARPGWAAAALAGSSAWGLLLLAAAMRGPAFELAEKVAGVFSLPAWGFIAVTLLFPTVLAGAACELSISARRIAVPGRRARPPVGG